MPASRRQAVTYAKQEHDLPVSQACRLFKIARSSYLYEPVMPDDAALRKAIRKLSQERRRWGYRRLMILLRRMGFTDNHKRIERVYREEGLQIRKRTKRRGKRVRGEMAYPPQRPIERFSMDFMHDSTLNSKKLRILNIVDDFTRECVACEVATSISGQYVTRVLDRAIELHGKPTRLLSDNGPEFISHALEEWAFQKGIVLDRIELGKPNQNAFVESFNGRMRDECLNENVFMDVREAKSIIEEWRNDYNLNRPHSSLNYLTPEEFRRDWEYQQEKIQREKGLFVSFPLDQLCTDGRLA